MIRLIFLLLITLLLGTYAVWFVENDGLVQIIWMGYEVSLSVSLFLILLAAAIVVGSAALKLLFGILGIFSWRIFHRSSSKGVSLERFNKACKGYERGAEELASGFVAVMSGNVRKAHQQAKKAEKYTKAGVLHSVLMAQIARAQKDEAEVGKILEDYAVKGNEDALFLEVRLEMCEAIEKGDDEIVIEKAKELLRFRPGYGTALEALLDAYKRQGNLDDVIWVVKLLNRYKMIDKDELKRRLSAIYVEFAKIASDDSRYDDALRFARKAYGNCQKFLPAAVMLAGCMIRSGKKFEAERFIVKVWKHNPHPHLLKLYTYLHRHLSKAKQVKKFTKLYNANPGCYESNIAMVRGAIAVKDFGLAHNHLESAMAMRKSRETYKLSARLEEMLSGDDEKVKELLGKASKAGDDPSWVCGECLTKMNVWDIRCTGCQAFDTVEWKDTNSK